MERWNSLPPIVRHIFLGLCLFTAGAVLAFGYSYRPLHGALAWRVDHLEARLDERNRENFALRDELSKLKGDETERIDPATLNQVRTELEKTRTALASAEKETGRLDKKRRSANANADRWRKRYETLRDESARAALPAAPAPTAAAAENRAELNASPTSTSSAADAGNEIPPQGPSLELQPAPQSFAPPVQASPSTDATESGMLLPPPAPEPNALP